MNPFLLSPHELLNNWKIFRESLKNKPEHEQLNLTSTYWAQAPISKMAYNIDDPKSWLGPWDMINEGEWDRNITAIGIFQTLLLAGWNLDRLELQYINDLKNKIMVMIVIVDKKYMLNYEWGNVSKYSPNHFVVLRTYTYDKHGYK